MIQAKADDWAYLGLRQRLTHTLNLPLQEFEKIVDSIPYDKRTFQTIEQALDLKEGTLTSIFEQVMEAARNGEN